MRDDDTTDFPVSQRIGMLDNAEKKMLHIILFLHLLLHLLLFLHLNLFLRLLTYLLLSHCVNRYRRHRRHKPRNGSSHRPRAGKN